MSCCCCLRSWWIRVQTLSVFDAAPLFTRSCSQLPKKVPHRPDIIASIRAIRYLQQQQKRQYHQDTAGEQGKGNDGAKMRARDKEERERFYAMKEKKEAESWNRQTGTRRTWREMKLRCCQ